MVTGILNRHLTTAIGFHDTLHVFIAGQWAGDVSPKAKLIQQPTEMKGAVLYDILLDLQKLYNALDKERCLEILACYGMGPWKSGLYVCTGYILTR